jgi:Cft2 family RNA processing exonuclease
MYEGGGSRLLFDIGGDTYGRFPHWSPEMHDLDAVFITHAHHDHIGGLFHLFDELEYQGRWYADPVTIACTRLALEDSRRLLEGGDRLSASGKRLVDHVMNRAVPLSAGKAVAVGNVAVTGYRAGHVIGSLQYLVETYAGGILRRVLISGDINPAVSLSVPALTLPPAALCEQVDALVVEGTNALRVDDPIVGGVGARHELLTLLDRQERWPVLLPAMSLGRAQEIIAALANTRWRVGVFGLAARMTEAMGITLPSNVSLVASKWRDTARGEFDVLVASAGSLQGGPARFFQQDSGWDPPIIFTGYLFPGTPGFALADRYPRVRFSGHASAESWREYCAVFPNATRFLVHYPGAEAPAKASGFVIPRANRTYQLG